MKPDQPIAQPYGQRRAEGREAEKREMRPPSAPKPDPAVDWNEPGWDSRGDAWFDVDPDRFEADW